MADMMGAGVMSASAGAKEAEEKKDEGKLSN